MHYLYRFALLVKRLLITIIVVVLWLMVYRLVITGIVVDGQYIVGSLVLWVLTAYFLLPRIHRRLSKIYLPDYFIGRVRTVDGLLGDPVNLGVVGTKAEFIKAMRRAGWHRADEVTLKSSWKIAESTIRRKSYPTAPVSPLFLFGNKQDLAFEQEVQGNPSKRHHVRFWKVPQGWYLPGGEAVDWLGAATYDTNVGFSLFTLQITHKIAEDTDVERDYVVSSIRKHEPKVHTKLIEHFSSGYHHRNGGGDRIKTDGNLPIIFLK
jgi:LssY C-terminus